MEAIQSYLSQSGLQNFELLTVGITIAAIGLLGFSVYFNDRRSITNRTFLNFALLTIAWSALNYIQFQVTFVEVSLTLIRTVIFFAVWHAFFFFKLSYVAFQTEYKFGKWFKFGLVPLVVVTSILTLTDLVLKEATEISETGRILTIENGPAIPLFGLLVIGLILGGLIRLYYKTLKARPGLERHQLRVVSLGATITLLLLLTFNMVLPAFFENSRFIPFGALFILPYVFFTYYASFKFKLFDIRIFSTNILTLVLTVVTFFEILFSQTIVEIVTRSGIFLMVLVFAILLNRTITKEVKLRQEVEDLATQLSKANDRLKELDKLKSEFVSLATHQLRGPLTSIKGYSSELLEEDFGQLPGEAKTAVKYIFDSSNSLASLVDDYLNVSRIEQGRMKYEMIDFDLGELVHQVINELKPNIQEKGLTISDDIDVGVLVNADQLKIKQIIANLVDNAVKYTQQGDIHVELEVDHTTRKARFSVEDRGVGISQKTMPNLFKKFSRAEDASKANIHGTGLGLYVASEIVKAHKGKIWAESEGEGKGSTFLVELNAK